MAVIKGNYVKRDRTAKARAKATIRYIQSRPGKKGEALTRELFGPDGELSTDEALRMITEAGDKTFFYRLVLSPDPNTEDKLRDIDLTDLAQKLMLRLGERLNTNIRFAGAVHDDHKPHRHAHILALLKTKLTRQDFQFLRQLASELILEQRRLRELAKTQTLSPVQNSSTKALRRQPQSASQQTGNQGAPVPITPVHSCPDCGTQAMQRLMKNLYRCGSCRLVIRQTGMGMQVERTDSGLSLGSSIP